MGLRERVIRLAYQKPSLRGELLPLLCRTARRDEWEQTIAGPKVRIRMSDRAVLIEELPGKPLKRKLGKLLMDAFYLLYSEAMNEFLVPNLALDAKFNARMDYGKAKKALQKALSEARKNAEKDRDLKPGFWKAVGWDSLIREEQVYYLNVEPADFTPLAVQGGNFSLTSTWSEFSATVSYSDDPHDPSYSSIQQKSPGGARKLYKILKPNPDQLKNLDFTEFSKWLTSRKIGHEQFSSSWR